MERFAIPAGATHVVIDSQVTVGFESEPSPPPPPPPEPPPPPPPPEPEPRTVLLRGEADQLVDDFGVAWRIDAALRNGALRRSSAFLDDVDQTVTQNVAKAELIDGVLHQTNDRGGVWRTTSGPSIAQAVWTLVTPETAPAPNPPPPPVTPPAPPPVGGVLLNRTGLSLTFSEDFSAATFDPATTTLNGRLATHLQGDTDPAQNWRNPWARTLHQSENGEAQWYVDPKILDALAGDLADAGGFNPFAVIDGVLHITARRFSPAVRARMARLGLDRGWTTLQADKPWASGVLSTARLFRQQYGVFEMRALLPAVRGAWPAFWLLRDPSNASPPEIDVFDQFNSGSEPDRLIAGVRSVDGNGGTGDPGRPIAGGVSGVWRTYGIEWTADRLRWFVDDVEVLSRATPSDMRVPMYMIANLAIAGPGFAAWADQPPAGVSSITMQVDWIRAWRRT